MTDRAWFDELRTRAAEAELNLSDEQLRSVLDLLAGLLSDRLAEGESLDISGLGRFDVRDLEGRHGMNPKQSGGRIWIESQHVVEFHPDDALAERLEARSAASAE